jgi:cobalt-zinc-cadmium efflux system membrane fusion protein
MKKRLLITVAAVACIATLGAFARWKPVWPWSSSKAADPAEQSTKPEEARTKVVLTPEKFATMRLSYAEVATHSLQNVRTVPGKIEYRSIRSVEIKAPVDLVVQKVLVKPGAVVEPGTKLAILTSPDVGMARAEVEKSESELKIANQAFEWADEITRNLNELLTFLRGTPSFEDVDQEFDTKLLGNHRQDILPAYSRYLAAEKLRMGAEKLLERGAISDQKAVQFASNSEMARQQYLSVCDQSRFDARQAREKARQNQMYAGRLRDVRRRELKTLLGEYSEISPSNDALPENGPDVGVELTRFYLIAPLAGTVERRSAADSQRVDAGTPLFMVANTETLEVRADVREGDWQAVSLSEGQMLKVVVTAVGEDREFDAKVDYVGRAVDAQTRAVPLVALLDNAKHEFKPGMFARIKIPSGNAAERLVVPAAAIRTQDNQDFVFVVDADEPRTFHRVDVAVGMRTPEWVAIAGGLTAGQRIVVEGAFLLKNELLLDRKAD